VGVYKVHIVQLLKKIKKIIQVYTWWFKPGRQYGRKKKKTFTIHHFRFWSTITSLDWSTYKGLRNVVVAHVKYNISHRNYPGGTEQKLFSVV
jgi:hypothetical protein